MQSHHHRSIFFCTGSSVAATRGSLDELEFLLSAKCNVECRSVRGETPLLMAASEGSIEAVQMLIEAKANINAASNIDCTPVRDMNGRARCVSC